MKQTKPVKKKRKDKMPASCPIIPMTGHITSMQPSRFRCRFVLEIDYVSLEVAEAIRLAFLAATSSVASARTAEALRKVAESLS